ncbi:MAG: anthranilate synthase component I [Chloroflexi bacterium]|nr:anthranilate synthase component I [Chloroflexota bacterium]
MIQPSFSDLEQLASRPARVAVYREILADMETPVSAYLKVADGPSFLLESVEGGEHLGRYSFIGPSPSAQLRLHATGTADLKQGEAVSQLAFEDPLALIDGIVAGEEYVPSDGLPRFAGGAVGYLSYEIARFFERLPLAANDPVAMPVGELLVVSTLLVFDHLRRTIKVIAHVRLDRDLREEYDAAESRIEALIERLAGPLPARADRQFALEAMARPGERPVSNVGQEAYEAAVRRSKEYIAAGDIIQAVISQRFEVETRADPFAIYRALRAINPSPYMYFLDFGAHQLVGASPELLVLAERGRVTTHPIAGTRPRGATPEEDDALAAELISDDKERAEHVMLVDLGRNDLGRIAAPGSVSVPKLMEIERYSHVMHIVSNVTARLRSDVRPIEALRATFPAGTVSGAPKIRAMEIIAELEPDQRGPYAGAIGFFGFDGELETAITIRTILVKNGRAIVQAGAGIVADSNPTKEFEECHHKAAAMFRAVRAAEQRVSSGAALGEGSACACS